MLEPWNDASILPPPVHTAPAENIDLKELDYICKSIIKVLTKQSPLHREAAILSRFLYKFDKKFRNDIGFRNFKKVHTALRIYLALNILKDVKSFVVVLPDDNERYFPTKQMLEYVLIRIITFAKIMLRICVCSKQAAVFYLDRVRRGESYWMSLMPYALLSRIWSMSVVLLQHSCNWYSKLHPFLAVLTFKGLSFLPEGYSLPEDLENWLDIKNLENYGRFDWSQKKKLDIDCLMMDDDQGDTMENIFKYVDLVNQEEGHVEVLEEQNVTEVKEKLKDTEILNIPLSKAVDQGEAISRDSFKNLFKTETVQKIHHYAERVTNKDTLQEFIATEENLRNEESNQSLTNHLSFMQWQALKNSLIKLLESLTNNRKIERKFQKIWKEKCIAYK